MPKGECSLVAGVELVERLSQQHDPIGIVDPIEVVERDAVLETVGCPPRAITPATTLPTVVIGELVGGDAKQPWRDPTGPPPKPVETSQGPFEGRRGDILGHVPVSAAPKREAMDRVDVTTVDLGERVGIGSRPFDELTLVERVGIIAAVDHCPPAWRIATLGRWQGERTG